MLFNSYTFIFMFLPVTVFLFHAVRQRGYTRGAFFILVLASLIFYGWWSPRYLLLLSALILINFGIAKGALASRNRGEEEICKRLCVLGIVVNLAALGYYKYANFFIDNINYFFGLDLYVKSIVLPIGISFFTFQKIAFLADIHENKIKNFNLLDFALFVTFFPQLIAGPIVHHSEIMPQFGYFKKISFKTVKVGMAIFIIGLAKKVILADTAAKFVSPVFNSAAGGMHLDFFAAWSAALAYTVQIYFDFSAYSDMAIGISQLFGIDLPINFDSPYKSKSIIEFWRRWHMTLSRFLRDYLYIPMGGNKRGKVRRYVNLLLTMLLGGIWHGAGWTYLLWGALHGMYLAINHGWCALGEKKSFNKKELKFSSVMGRTLTFLAVVVGWVFFRSSNVGTAFVILKGMIGFYGIAKPASLSGWSVNIPLSSSPVDSGLGLLTAIAMLTIAWFAPNTQQLTSYRGPENTYPALQQRPVSAPQVLAWRPSTEWAVYLGCLFAFCLMLFSQVSEFIYFQF